MEFSDGNLTIESPDQIGGGVRGREWCQPECRPDCEAPDHGDLANVHSYPLSRFPPAASCTPGGPPAQLKIP